MSKRPEWRAAVHDGSVPCGGLEGPLSHISDPPPIKVGVRLSEPLGRLMKERVDADSEAGWIRRMCFSRFCRVSKAARRFFNSHVCLRLIPLGILLLPDSVGLSRFWFPAGLWITGWDGFYGEDVNTNLNQHLPTSRCFNDSRASAAAGRPRLGSGNNSD